MDLLELKNPVRRLNDGECPKCGNRLHYMTGEFYEGILDRNAMASTINLIDEKYSVFCPICGYIQDAVHIGLKTIPIDRINKYDIDWDKKYIEENTLIYGEKGKNPFYKKEKD